VAVQKCYELRQGQKLLIEELGDITIENKQQIEVKQYSDKDNLTDGHHNFWNTLRNWIDDEKKFDHTLYTSLVLHTTQKFGPKTTISEWNDLDPDKRLRLLSHINEKAEAEYKKAKDADPKKNASAVLKHQRFVLDSSRESKLKDLIGKVWIEARAKKLPDLYEELKQDRVRGILSGKKDDYLNSLIGFVCRADKTAGERWEITYEAFEAKLGDLNATYNKETRIFPRQHFSFQESADSSMVCDYLFIRKIKDIKYDEVICDAIHDHEATILTIQEEFSKYAVDPLSVEEYANDIEKRFKADYRKACRRCSDEFADSKDLYDETVAKQSLPLSGFGDTPDGFRNGLLHQRMDTPDTDLKWKVQRK
jgi:hypothetical protein